MSFNELNSVEHFIIKKLSGKNLNFQPPPGVLMEELMVFGSFPWTYQSAEELNRPTEQVLIETELREALIRLNPEITANPAFGRRMI